MSNTGYYKVVMTSTTTVQLRVVGNISWWSNGSKDFMRTLDQLKAKGVTQLDLYINSGGGEVFEANEIANQIRMFPGKKGKCTIGALCASAATLLPFEFEEIEMAQNGMFMIHDPMISLRNATPKVLQSWLNALQNISQNIVKTYAKFTGLKPSEIIKMMDIETWMNASNAKKKGFITRVVGSVETEEGEGVENISAYNYRHMPTMLSKRVPPVNIEEMKKVYLALGLPENATEEQAIAAIEALNTTVNASRTQNATALIDQAIADNKIQLGDRDQYVKDATANYDLVARVLKNQTGATQISANTKETTSTAPKTDKVAAYLAKPDLKMEDFFENEDQESLDQIEAKHPEVYAKLYKKWTGTDIDAKK